MNKPLTIALLTLAFSVGMRATASAENLVKVNVPHDFLVQNKVMPAGTYILSPVDDVNGALAIRSVDGHSGAFLLPTAFQDKVVENPQLTFDSWGDVYFLTRIQTQFGVYTFTIPEGNTRMARAHAVNRVAGN